MKHTVFHYWLTQVKAKSFELVSCFDQKNRLVLFFLVGFLWIGFSKLSAQSTESVRDHFQIDTIIPNGYVLIPVKLLNADAISTVIGSHGVADIYETYEGRKNKLLFSKAKIIKSPVEDSTFSVLVKETKAHLLSNSENPFFAAVQNPKARAIETPQTTSSVRIIYQN